MGRAVLLACLLLELTTIGFLIAAAITWGTGA
jgi:hypothetical protein